LGVYLKTVILRFKEDDPLLEWLDNCRGEHEPYSKAVLKKLRLLMAFERISESNKECGKALRKLYYEVRRLGFIDESIERKI